MCAQCKTEQQRIAHGRALYTPKNLKPWWEYKEIDLEQRIAGAIGILFSVCMFIFLGVIVWNMIYTYLNQ